MHLHVGKKTPQLHNSVIPKLYQNLTTPKRAISFFSGFKAQKDKDSEALYKTFEWICKIFNWISFGLKAQTVVCAIGGTVILGGTAAVGYLINPNFSIALVPEALIGVVVAHTTYQLKEDVDKVGHALEIIKSLLEPEREERGFAATVIGEAFVELKEALLSSVKMMFIAPPLGTILTGVTGFLTGSYYLTFMEAGDTRVQTVASVGTVLCGMMAVGGVPYLGVSYGIYKRLKKKIEGVVDNLEKGFTSKLS